MASWVAGVAAGVASCVVSPLDRPCAEDEPDAPLGSELCSVVGAVLCVVGVACGLDADPLDTPVAVLCVLGVEVGDDGDVVPAECALWPETVPDELEPPRSACGAPECGAEPAWLSPVPLCVPAPACGAPPWPLLTAPCWPPLSPRPCPPPLKPPC
ncbi:MAG: hypothetical protein JO268_03750 [Pseudonocardiales bacterium]|nr:hypothetical protein [Pseudonocardiales bacterium]